MIFSKFRWNESTILELSKATKAYVYYRSTRMNLLTGYPEVWPLEKFTQELEVLTLQTRLRRPRVFHFHYEFGLVLMGLGHTVDETVPLAIELEFDKSQKRAPKKTAIRQLRLQCLERPSWSEYKGAFARIQEHLLNGNCYQVNLTYPFDFETPEQIDPRDLSDFFFSRKQLGAFAHCTFLGEEMILSNSPECLFQTRKDEVFTMPVKGTVKRGKDFSKAWRALLANVKEEGELSMITDLLKNDLNRLDVPAARVIKLRAPLLVPGLLHQYSLISVKLQNDVTLMKSLQCLFPGGSVTGAPKKRVMEIIQEVERYSRGIYSGSTLLCYQDKKVANINIRTASINPFERMWRYGAGSGITLLSKAPNEFQEMEAKVASFLTLFNAPGY
ncbi:MAG TPA: chorismate-binding protein [Bacteriovoracaceae bacterium]|nr:chorismate-binding protein [Bacteriovoracaceae bacterium]